jgi:hypothetical protein
LPQCDTNEVIVQIRAQKAAVDRAVPGGGGLEREEDPTAYPRVGELDPKGWVVWWLADSTAPAAAALSVLSGSIRRSVMRGSLQVRALPRGGTTTPEAEHR